MAVTVARQTDVPQGHMTSERGHLPTRGPVCTQTQICLPRRPTFLPASAAASAAKTRAQDPGFAVCGEHVRALSPEQASGPVGAVWPAAHPTRVGSQARGSPAPSSPRSGRPGRGCRRPALQACHAGSRVGPQARKPRCRQLEARPKGPEGGRARGRLAGPGQHLLRPKGAPLSYGPFGFSCQCRF